MELCNKEYYVKTEKQSQHIQNKYTEELLKNG